MYVFAIASVYDRVNTGGIVGRWIATISHHLADFAANLFNCSNCILLIPSSIMLLLFLAGLFPCHRVKG